jgi:alkylated DNA repair dioxygenase AlkB
MRRRDDHACRHEYWLAPGTLLLMGPGMQAQWQHALPKARHISTPRINLTFRFLLPRR